MKRDKLEDFILHKRAEFDDLEPGPEIWSRVQTPMLKPKVNRIYPISLAIAAAIIVLLSLYIFMDRATNSSRQQEIQMISEIPGPDQEKLQELMEAEVFYTSQINSKKDQIYIYAGENADFLSDLDMDLSELDAVFKELKQDLLDNGNNIEVLEAMIQNYRIKLQILEEVLVQLEKTQSPNDQKNEYHEL